MEYSRLDEKAKKSWFISRLIALIIISGILITSRIVLKNKLASHSFIANIVVGVIVLLLIINTFIHPSIEYKQWKYIITEDRIEFIHGIYFLTTTIVPIVRIQHVKISQGPINRIFNLADIEIHTAGGVHEIPGFPKEKAEEISTYLKDKVHIKVNERIKEKLINEEENMQLKG